ncbi:MULTISPECIES: ExbD/TolR family protein [Mucilaginibacter]|jgi:biopolymer transport protein ExbD|uniref:Biopolymer transporter ExbD n=1 Tax=Mucilaginibacter rubeus TaxID=2027860 RepID=A0AAE6MJQ5_9SPHI|nr:MULTISPECIES: biopolymer transporter ExbD [Mucilaginibacter]QEM05482.1 biopolymer transporter ExbD [Mucilaginibacter rubeus]QEM18066.1 biopolymer transporter ExbD [Mucilaginibacter gossypii]QTE45397.1 biopolymer transporter ExbD [Mucilaginibacter rubeus]QTE51994.1 biopolymer transporter ExbD [Mucilaginibacter rubeus]QTE57083.1 biopolymer transporter ExbD [Mucilaginibacter rubeus]
MARIKVPRKSTAIDMTAMCDVAFLLLTFFIMTAKVKTEDPVPIDIPKSSIQQPVPESDFATVSVGNQKAFFGVEGVDIRKEMLNQMGSIYHMTFTPEEQTRFSSINSFGVPMNQLKQFIALSADQQKKYAQPGIPRDSVSAELTNWIRQARIATKALHNKELRLAIKGDSKEEYPVIKDVIGILQKQKVNKFSLITDLGSAGGAPKK